jgi:MFS family permease
MLGSGGAVVLALIVGLWFVLGPGKRDRADDRRRLGGRKPKSHGFFAMPVRDKDYTPGVFLALLATWSLADVATGAASSLTMTVLAGTAAALYAARPGMVGTGLGFVGVVSVIVGRFQGGDCATYSHSDQIAFWVGAALILIVLVVLRLVLAPVRTAQRFLTGPVSFWSAGHDKRPSAVTTVMLSTFGALDLLNLATQPGQFHVPVQWTGATVAAAVTMLVLVGALAVALTVLPSFTLSVLGLATLAGTIIVEVVTPGCTNWGRRIGITAVFFIVNRLGSLLLGGKSTRSALLS